MLLYEEVALTYQRLAAFVSSLPPLPPRDKEGLARFAQDLPEHLSLENRIFFGEDGTVRGRVGNSDETVEISPSIHDPETGLHVEGFTLVAEPGFYLIPKQGPPTFYWVPKPDDNADYSEKKIDEGSYVESSVRNLLTSIR